MIEGFNENECVLINFHLVYSVNDQIMAHPKSPQYSTSTTKNLVETLGNNMNNEEKSDKSVRI